MKIKKNIAISSLILVLLFFSNIMGVKAQDQKKDIIHQTFGNVDFKETLYSGNKTNYMKLPTEYAKAYGSFSYASLPLERQIAEEVRLWVSSKYKCSYCLVFHANDLKESGIDQHKINNIMAYRESELFSEKEKAALNFAAAISNVDYEKMSESLIKAKQYFNDEEIETIISCTLLMDIWTRIFAVKGKVPYYAK